MARLSQLVILLAVWIRPGETQVIYPVLDLAPAPSAPATKPPVQATPKQTPEVPPKQPVRTTPAQTVKAQPKPPYQPLQISGPRTFNNVWARVRRYVNTECKACPDPLCLNKDWYGSSYMFRTDCYTTGALVNNTRQWLRSETGCFVSQFDTISYHRNYTADIKTCAPVKLEIARTPFTIPSQVQCRICPHEKCEVVREYSRGEKAKVICEAATVLEPCMTYCPRSEFSADTQVLIGNTTEPADPEWLKTEDNCYIHSTKVKARRDTDSSQIWRRLRKLGIARNQLESAKLNVPNCGAVPFLSNEMHSPPPPPKIIVSEIPLATWKPWVPPPPPQCLTCAPFIWTMPVKSTTIPNWPFSPTWLSLATPIPKIETGHQTIPTVPATKPSFPGLSSPTPAPPPRLIYPTIDLAPAPSNTEIPPPSEVPIEPTLELNPSIPDPPDSPIIPDPPALPNPVPAEVTIPLATPDPLPAEATIPLAPEATPISPPPPETIEPPSIPQPADPLPDEFPPALEAPDMHETSQDGTCGGHRGLACPKPSCCSQWWFCGNTPSHCGEGCNPAYGSCG